MKKLLLILALLLSVWSLPAQTNSPVRLAIVPETPEADMAADVLTVELSSQTNLQLLERNEIDKVYREQGLSAGNKDYLKLGQILGADGLLLVKSVEENTNELSNSPFAMEKPQALTVRLIAVKPGAVLTDEHFSLLTKELSAWSSSFAKHLNLFLPKLSVLAKDAIPISVVNLRSAVSSAEAVETEGELKTLTIQRLSQEKELFVLERQKMQLLSEEKELKADDSAFWDGSYLLEGAVDQNGYSKEIITINARLTPPKGGIPLRFEVSGSRTNLAEVVNQLVEKVNEILKIHSTVKEWNAADEAAQYYDEARWALRWEVYSEAEAAADSAWALGKRDIDCAIVRIKAYETPLHSCAYQNGEFTNPSSTNEVIQTAEEEAAPNHPWGLTLRVQHDGGAILVKYVFADKLPDPKSIEAAMHALELYYEFSRNSPEGLLTVASARSSWKNSEWYNLGIEDLVAASIVLQNFNFVPEAQKTVFDKLANLRALTRSVAEWISESPSVHDSYFVGDRLATHDELANTIEESPNIFKCEVKWGYLWQERPEDCVALYRALMSSPVFSYIHNDLWLRELQSPRLVAWNESDQQRIPIIWSSFVQELNVSTNIFFRLEAKAIKLADADNESQMAVSFTNLFSSIFESRTALVADNVEVLYLDWGIGDLVSAKTGNGIASDIKDSLNHVYYSEYSPKLEAMDREYWNKTVPAKKVASIFDKQKEYLKDNTPFDFFEFVNLFSSRDFSKAEAVEIQPLIVAYKSNLVAQAQTAAGIQKGQLMNAMAQVGFLENDVNRILNPQLQPQPKIQVLKPVVPKTVAIAPMVANAPEIVTNVIAVSKFFAIPLDSLYHLNDGEQLSSSSATITAHHWFDGRLLLDFQYSVSIELHDERGVTGYSNNRADGGLGKLDLSTGHPTSFTPPIKAIQESSQALQEPGDLPTRRSVTAIANGTHGDIWFLTDDSLPRLHRYKTRSHTWEVVREACGSLASDSNRLLLGQDPNVLYSGENNWHGAGGVTVKQLGVSILDFNDGRWRNLKSAEGLPSGAATALALDGDDLWVAGLSYIAVINLPDGKVRKFARISAERVDQIEIAGGYVWATYNGALHRSSLGDVQ